MSYYSNEVQRIHSTVLPRKDIVARIVAAKQFMDANYREPLTLDTIAGVAATSRFHFTRQFRRLYGRSPWQYLIEVRNEQAKALLLRGASVNEACFSVGYDSPTSFTRLFKRMTGRTPAALRNSNSG